MGIDSPGLDDAALARAVDFAREADTAQLTIAHRGEVVVELADDPDPLDVFAVQKVLVSAMCAIAEDRDLLRLDDPVADHLGTGWTQLDPGAEQRLTIERVLDMTTGVDQELRPLGEVGVSWRYDNVSYNYLKTLLEIVSGRSMSELTEGWLLGPLGMTSTRWVERQVTRPDGRAITGMLSTSSDLARYGALVLAGGGDLVPAGHIARIGRPGSDENPSWGLCWWNNDQDHHRLPGSEGAVRPGPTVPAAPADLLLARGAMENRLYVVPSMELVVARTFRAVSRDQRPVRFDQPFWELLLGSDAG